MLTIRRIRIKKIGSQSLIESYIILKMPLIHFKDLIVTLEDKLENYRNVYL